MEINAEQFEALLSSNKFHDAECIGYNEFGATYLAKEIGFVLWDSNGMYYLETTEEFQGELP